MATTQIRNNQLTITDTYTVAALKAGNGTVSLPSLTFSGDDNTGLYWVSSDTLGIATGGVQAARFTSGSLTLSAVGSGLFLNGGGGSSAFIDFYPPASGQNGIFWGGSFTTIRSGANGSFSVGTSSVTVTPVASPTTTFNNGGITLSAGQFRAPDGTVGTPSIVFSNDTDMGLYRIGTDTMGIATLGTEAIRINASQDVGIGGAPVTNGILTISSTSKAFVPPRMTGTQRDAITPLTAGMTIYNTDDNELNVYNGSVWIPVGSTAFPLLAPDGTAGAPSYSFEDQSNTGLFRTGLFLSVTSNATEVVRFGDSGIEVQPDMPLKNSAGLEASPSYTFVDDESAGLFLDTNDLVFVTNSTSALSIGTDQSIDFLLHEAKNLVVHLLASNPVSPVEGQIWYNTTTKQWVGYNGTINVVLG